MLPSSKYSETNSNYGYALGPIQHNNNATNQSVAYADSSHYYSGVYPGNGFSSRDQSVYGTKAYSNVQTEPLTGSQVPLTIVDPPHEPIVRSYLVWSLFNLLCCGLIAGLVATIFSFKVRSLTYRRAYKEAQRLSDRLLFGNMIITMLGAFLFIVIFPYVYVEVYPYLPKINY